MKYRTLILFKFFDSVLHGPFWSALIIALLAFLPSGCGFLDVGISYFGSNDFGKSEILTNDPVVADGQSELLVVIKLKNSNGKPIQFFKPTYQVVSDSGITSSECTPSNVYGVSTCVLKSTQSGTRRLSVTNVRIRMEKEIIFVAPSQRPSVGMIVASQKASSGQYEMSGTLGSQEPGATRTKGAYKFYGGVRSEAYSR